MADKSDVRLVYPHAEREGGNHDDAALLLELLLVLVPFFRIQAYQALLTGT